MAPAVQNVCHKRSFDINLFSIQTNSRYGTAFYVVCKYIGCVMMLIKSNNIQNSVTFIYAHVIPSQTPEHNDILRTRRLLQAKDGRFIDEFYIV